MAEEEKDYMDYLEQMASLEISCFLCGEDDEQIRYYFDLFGLIYCESCYWSNQPDDS